MSISGFGSKPDLFPKKQASVMQDNVRGRFSLAHRLASIPLLGFSIGRVQGHSSRRQIHDLGVVVSHVQAEMTQAISVKIKISFSVLAK